MTDRKSRQPTERAKFQAASFLLSFLHLFQSSSSPAFFNQRRGNEKGPPLSHSHTDWDGAVEQVADIMLNFAKSGIR